MRFVGRCYRGHDPAWSFSPISGEGAAIAGGRFNRNGEPTLYLSLDVMTAIAECTQGFTRRLHPLTMCEYDVECDDIADLRDETGRADLHIAEADLGCAWLSFQLAGKPAPSWLVADRLRAEGYAGALVPCFAPGVGEGSCNLVLWRWSADPPHRVAVFDPAGRLPRDRLSWDHGKE